ncbi:MAG: AAA family ATPase [Ruminococcus sp.]|nr:AAA family ATPase [Ruminococcus sp.]
MKLNELKSSKDYTMTSVPCRMIKPVSELNKIKINTCSVSMENDSVFILENPVIQSRIRFEVTDISQKHMLADFIFRRFSNLAQIIRVSDSNNGNMTDFFLHIVFFVQKDWFPEMSVLINEKVNEQLEKKKISIENLIERFLLDDGENKFLAYTNGNYRQELYALEHPEDTESDNNDDYDDDEEDNTDSEKAFFNLLSDQKIKLFGNGIIMYISRKSVSQNNAILIADKVVFREANPPCMKLAVCHLEFTDQKKYIIQQTEALFRDNSGYLKLWEEYTSREGEALLQTARNIGVLEFTRHNYTENGQLVLLLAPQCRNAIDYISAGDTLLFTENIPEYIDDPMMTWDEYKEIFNNNSKGKSRGKGANFSVMRVDTNNYTIYVKTDGLMSENKAVFSISGELQQIIRRERVRQVIFKGECAYPQLGLLIEGKLNNNTLELRNPKKKEIVPITPFVQQKIFSSHPPTDNQKEAIRIALNTPDIALIQGPPGTGKTTVINAIIERINELEDKSGEIKGRVLITSTQHDAVTNLTERMNLNGIPTPKFGRKSGESSQYGDDNIMQWCEDVKKKLALKYPYIREIERRHTLDKCFFMYQNTPSEGTAVSFLQYAKTVNTDISLNEQIERLIEEFRGTEENSSDDDMMIILRRIRTRKESFRDDGPESAMNAYSRLRDIPEFADSNRKVLLILKEAVKADRENVSDELLKSLRKLKQELMELYIPEPRYRKEQMDNRIVEIYTRLKDNVVSVEDEEQKIIFDFYNELDNNQLSVKSALNNYSYAFGATLQQSVSKSVVNAKTGGQKGVSVIYDTVIVDEAARANPGDLLIPLSLASKRIILVGDHRQLPHMYKEEIFRELNDDDKIVNSEDISKSMFQHLWEKAVELQKLDGIQRTVRLDRQYRTHPLLGQFVSNEFYAPHGEEYHSPLPAEMFSQELYDSPLRWIHMPYTCGKMTDSVSKSRPCEAKYIADTLHKYICSEKGKNLTYGVITFYSAQASLIRKELNVYPECSNVRVGSADAFQGMEFDVIFLSVVRTAVKGKRSYGFLKSLNRLCVAFSRQKKLLIIVGDGDMFSGDRQSDIAEKEIPSMKHLYDICQKKGWVVNYAESQSNQ